MDESGDQEATDGPKDRGDAGVGRGSELNRPNGHPTLRTTYFNSLPQHNTGVCAENPNSRSSNFHNAYAHLKMKLSDYEWIDKGRRRERVLIEVMDKPRTAAEARRILMLKTGNKLDLTFRELTGRGLLRILADGVRGLTSSGQRLRKRLLKERAQPYKYTEHDIDWPSYAWVIKGRQRTTLLKALDVTSKIMPRILKRTWNTFHSKMSRTRAYELMNVFLKRGLAIVTENNPQRSYAISQKGTSIKEQLLAAWLAFFAFY